MTPLDVAAATESAEITSALLLAGANPDSAVYACTPLHTAAWLCNSDIAALLLFAGASGAVEHPGTPTPTELAEGRKCTAVSDLLRAAQPAEPGD